MEIGRTDFCKTSGFNYHDLEKEAGAFIAVAEASCRYVASARYDDEILVRTTIERTTRRVLSFTYTILNGETGMLLAEGKTVHVVVNKEGKPRSLPAAYYELLIKNAGVSKQRVALPGE
jgi:acyl-CoA thioester hydrolase